MLPHISNQHSKNDEHAFWIGLLGGIFGTVLTVAVVFSLITSGTISLLPSSGNDKPSLVPRATNVIEIADVVADVNPSVVSIVITKDVPVMERYYVNPFGANSPFQFRIPQYRQKGTQSKQVGGGSGFLISSDGYLVSNAHVVLDSSAQYTVFLNSGQKYDAKVIAQDKVLDIALLKIEATELSYLQFGDSDQIRLGQTVIAIGNALGEFRNTVSTGVISGLSRSIQAGDGRTFTEKLDNLIQTDAAINPGNSGGPLINTLGQVIGINVAVAQGSENIGFSIPSNLVKRSIELMKAETSAPISEEQKEKSSN